MSQISAKFRQYISESSAQQNFTEGQTIQEWKKSRLFKKPIYLLIRKMKRLSHNIVWNQQLDCLFNIIYRLTTTGTLWGESSDDRRDPLTKDLWWMITMRWRHDQSKNVIKDSKDLIDSNPLTHPQTQTIPKKKIAVVLVDTQIGRDCVQSSSF